MAFHPVGLVVDVVGTEANERGRSCDVHDCCGSVLVLDAEVRFRCIQITYNGQEQTALAVYWVTDGDDRCRVGFLRRHLVKHQADYDGKLAQVVEIVGANCGVEDRAKQKRCRGLSRVCLIDPEIALL
jgi:hypothetical protein